jgi:hypothetical protein
MKYRFVHCGLRPESGTDLSLTPDMKRPGYFFEVIPIFKISYLQFY